MGWPTGALVACTRHNPNTKVPSEAQDHRPVHSKLTAKLALRASSRTTLVLFHPNPLNLGN